MRLLSSEVLKLTTTRVPYVLLALTMLLGGLVSAALVGSGELGRDDDPALALAQGVVFWSTLATIIGILIVTNEYRHGTVMTTFLAEPRRPTVFASKLAIATLAGAVFALAAFLVVLLVAVPWMAARDETLAFDGQLLEALGRLTLAFALFAALGAAVGAIIQNQVGAIVAVFVWFLIAETIIGVVATLLSGGFDEVDPVSRYLPGNALAGIVGGQAADFMLRGPAATAISLLYVAGLSAAGALSMTRRDP